MLLKHIYRVGRAQKCTTKGDIVWQNWNQNWVVEGTKGIICKAFWTAGDPLKLCRDPLKVVAGCPRDLLNILANGSPGHVSVVRLMQVRSDMYPLSSWCKLDPVHIRFDHLKLPRDPLKVEAGCPMDLLKIIASGSLGMYQLSNRSMHHLSSCCNLDLACISWQADAS